MDGNTVVPAQNSHPFVDDILNIWYFKISLREKSYILQFPQLGKDKIQGFFQVKI